MAEVVGTLAALEKSGQADQEHARRGSSRRGENPRVDQGKPPPAPR